MISGFAEKNGIVIGRRGPREEGKNKTSLQKKDNAKKRKHQFCYSLLKI
jgi:hypothetical protein